MIEALGGENSPSHQDFKKYVYQTYDVLRRYPDVIYNTTLTVIPYEFIERIKQKVKKKVFWISYYGVRRFGEFIKFKEECSKTGTTEESLAAAEKIGFKTNLKAINPLKPTEKVQVYFCDVLFSL